MKGLIRNIENGMRKIYSRSLSELFASKLPGAYRIRKQTPEEVQTLKPPKLCVCVTTKIKVMDRITDAIIMISLHLNIFREKFMTIVNQLLSSEQRLFITLTIEIYGSSNKQRLQ